MQALYKSYSIDLELMGSEAAVGPSFVALIILLWVLSLLRVLSLLWILSLQPIVFELLLLVAQIVVALMSLIVVMGFIPETARLISPGGFIDGIVSIAQGRVLIL